MISLQEVQAELGFPPMENRAAKRRQSTVVVETVEKIVERVVEKTVTVEKPCKECDALRAVLAEEDWGSVKPKKFSAATAERIMAHMACPSVSMVEALNDLRFLKRMIIAGGVSIGTDLKLMMNEVGKYRAGLEQEIMALNRRIVSLEAENARLRAAKARKRAA